MDYNELMDYLDLEDPTEFIYFEAMADLIECDEPVEQEAVQRLFDGADKEMIAQLLDDYFEEILDALPEDSGEVFSMLHQIKLSLIGIAGNCEDDSDIRRLADSFIRFRDWYCYDSVVSLSPMHEGRDLKQSLRDAITTARIEKLDGTAYRYDFTGAQDYPLDSYEVSLAALMAAENGYDDDDAYVEDTAYQDEEVDGYLREDENEYLN